jgi:ribosome biogenesis GTPase
VHLATTAEKHGLMNKPTWESFPWDEYSKSEQIEVDASLTPGRIVSQEGPTFEVVTPVGAAYVTVGGRLDYLIGGGLADFPAVGDYVLLQSPEAGQERHLDAARIERVLPRTTVFRRREAGDRNDPQVICANADVAVIMTTAPQAAARSRSSANTGLATPQTTPVPDPPDGGATGQRTAITDTRALTDYSARRIERYLATLDHRIRPIVVINKIDLVDDEAAVRRAVTAELSGASIVTLSALTGYGVDRLVSCLGSRETAVLVGSSGCGKSTLINRLTGEVLRTRDVRSTDGRGRHTTTTRRMYQLAGGSLLVDTPGMREVQLWAEGDQADDAVKEAFPEIAELSAECRFRNCTHESEPGCAVQAAVRDGEVTQERYLAYLELRREATRIRDNAAVRARIQERRAARRSRMRRRSRGG